MPVIRTPDGRRLRVPDDATPEQIQAVLASVGAGAPAAPTPGPATPPPAAPGATGGPVGTPPAPPAATPVPPPAGGAPARPVDHLAEGAREQVGNMSRVEKILAGMGASVDSGIRGVRQAWNAVTGDEETLARLKEEENTARRINQPLMDDGWGMTGNIAGHVAQFAIPGGAVARGAKLANRGLPAAMAMEGALGAGMGAVAPITGDESRAQNAIVGGTVGAALPGGVAAGRHLASIPSNILRSRILRAAMPHGLGSVADITAAAMSPSRGSKKVGQRLARIASEGRVEIQPLLKKIDPILRRYGNDVPEAIRNHVDELRSLAAQSKSAKLKGEMAQNMASGAFETADSMTGPGRIALRNIGRVVRDELQSSLPAHRARALRQAWQQYRTGVKPTNANTSRMSVQAMLNALRGDRPPVHRGEQDEDQ